MSDKKQLLMNFEAPHNNTDTSKLAAEEIKPHLGRLQSRVYSYILKQGYSGATCEEVERALNLGHQTVSPRILELRYKGKLKDSGHRRLTTTKRLAIVYVENNVPPSKMGNYKTLSQRHKELRDSYNLLKQKFEDKEDLCKKQERAIEHCIDYAAQRVYQAEAELRPKVHEILRGK